ncbi:MAG: hypothetical protein RRA35_13340, partial [Desulfomonilia bacterium]|nr:hypothetical protein [Desulfomonilia bacterium]
MVDPPEQNRENLAKSMHEFALRNFSTLLEDPRNTTDSQEKYFPVQGKETALRCRSSGGAL